MKTVKNCRAAIIDAGIGNIDSVSAVLRYLGAEFSLASSANDLANATHVILPGVGAFRAGMAALERHGLVEAIRAIAHGGHTKLLGICLGMQLLGEFSEEGDCEGLGLVPFKVNRIRGMNAEGCAVKVPHVGFSTVSGYHRSGLFKGLEDTADFYFTHSFAASKIGCEANIARVDYGAKLVAAFETNAVCGAQFHPEKSQSNGLELMKNFLEF